MSVENVQIGPDFQEKMKADRKGKRTVAILGMAESSRHLAPWDDPDVEIWSLNESNRDVSADGQHWLKRWNRWFQMHKKFDYRRPNNQNDPEHWAWLKSIPAPGQEGTFPIYMQEADPDVPASVVFPKDQIVDKFLGNYRRIGDEGDKKIEYFESTAAYMLALAAYEGYERIEVYGIEMSFSTEYKSQRVNFHFWLGVAGQYAEIILPANSSLMTGPRYGYDQTPKLNPTQFALRVRSMEQQYNELRKVMIELKMQQGTTEKEIKAFAGDATRVKGLRNKLDSIKNNGDIVASKMNQIQGHIDEANFVLETMNFLSPVQAPTEEVPELAEVEEEAK